MNFVDIYRDVIKEKKDKNDFIKDNILFINDLIGHSKDSYFKWDIHKREITIYGVLSNLIREDSNYYITISEEMWYSLILAEDLKFYLEEIEDSLMKKRDAKICLRVRNRYNTTIWLEKNLKPILNDNMEITAYFGYIHDISREVQIEHEFRNIIEYDEVTELPTKYYIKETIESYFEMFGKSEKRGALIVIDIDNFKFINDSFGHHEGDLLLKEVADCLIDIIADEDIISRYSGDEFVIFKPFINSIEDAEEVTRRVLASFEEPKIINGKHIYVTASAGIAVFPDNGTTFYDLLKNADAAMYRAKENGKNEYDIFDKSISLELNRMYLIHKGLRKAIEKNEMFVVFQPKVALSSSVVNGFEALLRWNSKELGFVSPMEFIPVAESTRLIIPIGRFVLEEVFKKVKELNDNGYENFKVAINISEVQLRYENILQDLKDLIGKYDVKPEYIEIEITESILMKSFDKNIHKLEAIKELGISIALDDFGTGYSSLNYLTKLPIDVLKIDRSFVIDLFKNNKSRCIVENIIQLSHKLGIQVVAEGVEETSQVQYLKSIYCDLVQGYYYSKPKMFEEIRLLLGKTLEADSNK